MRSLSIYTQENKTDFQSLTTVKLLKIIKPNLKIARLTIFCIIAYILIPKIADCTGAFSIASAKSFSSTNNQSLTTSTVNSQISQDIYIPPNYGSPESQHGTGTR